MQDDLNQYQRKHNLEIHGIPERENEDLEVIVEELGKAVEVEIEYSDIDHRLPSKLKPRLIIVKFKSYNDKSNLYQARWKLRSYVEDPDANLNGAQKIYINENLTSTRKRLFAEVRKRAKQYHWHTASTKDGNIFVRKEKGGKAQKITRQADLEELYH